VARCGEVRTPHWAHRALRKCDSWHENETNWHRKWKNEFEPSWQEIVHRDLNGERHIADVKTSAGWVFEFQHSSISPQERDAREGFYPKLIWVVDGTRRHRDKKRFMEVISHPDPKSKQDSSPVFSTFPEGALLRDWINSEAHVFFDFNDETLYWLLPGSSDYWAFIVPTQRHELIELHSPNNEGKFDELLRTYHCVAPKLTKQSSPPRPPTDPLEALLAMQKSGFRRNR
jgi:competence protein CoiA